MDLPILQPEERVLSTLESDGSRRWLYPRLSKGRFWWWRRVVAYSLIAIYALLPFVKINGKPAILLDIAAREFTFFGFTFLPTDTLLLALFAITVFLTIFFVTAIAGRVWCGWACPQTVYMEFLFRPIERLFTGTTGIGKRPRKEVAAWRIAAMYLVFTVICIHLSNMFLAYFVGVDKVHEWIWASPPWEHPTAFATVVFVTGLMLFDFGYWREQLCIVACPYGRFQSVLLDRWSSIIGYDEQRGEPRGKGRDREARQLGHCVDCNLCVDVCPTGIDIRDGLQLECVACAQCIDVCDEVMIKTNQPTGLIRYCSQAGLEGESLRIARPRTILYFLAIALLTTLFIVLLVTKSSFDVTILRGRGRPFVVNETGNVDNTLLVKVVNRTAEPRDYRLEVLEPTDVEITYGGTLEQIAPGETETEPMRVTAASDLFRRGTVDVKLRVVDDLGEAVEKQYILLGPRGQAPQPSPRSEADDDQ